MEAINFMRHLLRHNGTLGVLSALVAVVLLHGNLIGYRLQVPGWGSSTHVADTAPLSPQQKDGQEHRLALPFCATAPATYSEQLLRNAFDDTPSSKRHPADEVHTTSNHTQSFLAAYLHGGVPISRTHLFCVYRL